MSDHNDSGGGRFALLLCLAVGFFATLAGWYGIAPGLSANSAPAVNSQSDADASEQGDSMVTITGSGATMKKTIQMPHFEPLMPPGKYRDVFLGNCVTCHSPRLMVDQPPMSHEEWEEHVQKMISSYGAHIAAEDVPKIAEYLYSVTGPADATDIGE